MKTGSSDSELEQQIEDDLERVETARERIEDDRERIETDRERLEDEREDGGDHGHHSVRFEIFIDRTLFKVEEQHLTGTQLRGLPEPPIGQDRDLWEEIPGPGDDQKIGDEQVIEMRNGLHFFTTPRHVTPGACDAATR